MFFSSKKSVLGVDIGTTNIKIAQVTTEDDKHWLDTYGLVNVSFEIDEQKQPIVDHTVEILTSLMERAGVTTKHVVASLPNSAVFTSLIQLPPVEESRLKSAVEFEAKKYVPLPMSEVALSWVVIDTAADGRTNVLIIAVPNVIRKNYISIFEKAGLDLIALDIEAMALIRSVIGEDKSNDLLIDIGAKATHLNIIDQGNLVLTRNIPIGGETITVKIAESLNISLERAEQFKKDFGVSPGPSVPETIRPILNTIKNEAKQLQGIYRVQGKTFNRIIIVGGGANLPGLDGYLKELQVQIVNGDPLSRVSYNAELKPLLSQYASNLAVAIGLALRTK